MTEQTRKFSGTHVAERIIFIALAMGGVVLFTLLPEQGVCGIDWCRAHRYDYELSWWVFLVPVAVTEAALRIWQIKSPGTSRQQVSMRIGIRLLVASLAFGAGYFASTDHHEPRSEEAAAEGTSDDSPTTPVLPESSAAR